MSLHYEGYYKARELIFAMTDEQLLSQIDSLYGRDNLPDGYTHEQLLNETLTQVDRDWTDTSSKEYEQVQFWTKVAKASMKHDAGI